MKLPPPPCAVLQVYRQHFPYRRIFAAHHRVIAYPPKFSLKIRINQRTVVSFFIPLPRHPLAPMGASLPSAVTSTVVERQGSVPRLKSLFFSRGDGEPSAILLKVLEGPKKREKTTHVYRYWALGIIVFFWWVFIVYHILRG